MRRALLTLTMIAVVLGAGGCSSGTSVPIDSYRATGDHEITVTVLIGEHDTIRRTTVREDSTSVTIEVFVDRAGGIGTDVGVKHDVAVVLKDPLGDRKVVDGKGSEVPESTG